MCTVLQMSDKWRAVADILHCGPEGPGKLLQVYKEKAFKLVEFLKEPSTRYARARVAPAAVDAPDLSCPL